MAAAVVGPPTFALLAINASERRNLKSFAARSKNVKCVKTWAAEKKKSGALNNMSAMDPTHRPWRRKRSLTRLKRRIARLLCTVLERPWRSRRKGWSRLEWLRRQPLINRYRFGEVTGSQSTRWPRRRYRLKNLSQKSLFCNLFFLNRSPVVCCAFAGILVVSRALYTLPSPSKTTTRNTKHCTNYPQLIQRLKLSDSFSTFATAT